jgi:tRNA A37 methylthiotransferase MiaB
MPRQVPPEVKADRVRKLRALEAATRRRYYERLVGRTLGVLVQSPSDAPGRVRGTACRYAAVEMPGTMARESQIVAARAVGTDGERIDAVADEA